MNNYLVKKLVVILVMVFLGLQNIKTSPVLPKEDVVVFEEHVYDLPHGSPDIIEEHVYDLPASSPTIIEEHVYEKPPVVIHAPVVYEQPVVVHKPVVYEKPVPVVVQTPTVVHKPVVVQDRVEYTPPVVVTESYDSGVGVIVTFLVIGGLSLTCFALYKIFLDSNYKKTVINNNKIDPQPKKIIHRVIHHPRW